MKRLFFFVLFVSLTRITSACAFHFVPFGADWGNAFFLNSYPFIQDGKNIGILNYQRNFNKQFVLDLPNGVRSPFIFNENISTKSVFSRIYSSHRMQCNLAFSSTDIRFDAASETGKMQLHSWSKNEINFYGNVLLFETAKNKKHISFFMDYGFKTALFSKHGIDNTIGWLKLEMEKITPRLLAGNYKNNLLLGVSALVDFKRVQVYTSGNISSYFQTKDGFNYAKEINLSSTMCYKVFANSSTKLQVCEGLYFEHSSQDEFYESGKRMLSAPCGIGQGSDLFLSSGVNLQYQHISFFAKYYHPLWQNSFSEHQLSNQSIFLAGMGFTF